MEKIFFFVKHYLRDTPPGSIILYIVFGMKNGRLIPVSRGYPVISCGCPLRGDGGLLFPCRKSSKSALKGRCAPLENPLNVLFCLRYDLVDWWFCGVQWAVSGRSVGGYALLPGEAAGALRQVRSVQRGGTTAQQRNLPLEPVVSRRSPAHQRRY